MKFKSIYFNLSRFKLTCITCRQQFLSPTTVSTLVKVQIVNDSERSKNPYDFCECLFFDKKHAWVKMTPNLLEK